MTEQLTALHPPSPLPQCQTSDLRLRPVGTDAPALRQSQSICPTRLQTQTTLSEHTGHRFLLGDPEEMVDKDGGQWTLLFRQQMDGIDCFSTESLSFTTK